MGKEFRELVAEALLSGAFTQNAIESIRDKQNRIGHGYAISRLGERHSSGGVGAESVELTYEGAPQIDDQGLEMISLSDVQPWEQVSPDETVLIHIHDFKIKS